VRQVRCATVTVKVIVPDNVTKEEVSTIMFKRIRPSLAREVVSVDLGPVCAIPGKEGDEGTIAAAIAGVMGWTTLDGVVITK
jgi:hypothetical protein